MQPSPYHPFCVSVSPDICRSFAYPSEMDQTCVTSASICLGVHLCKPALTTSFRNRTPSTSMVQAPFAPQQPAQGPFESLVEQDKYSQETVRIHGAVTFKTPITHQHTEELSCFVCSRPPGHRRRGSAAYIQRCDKRYAMELIESSHTNKHVTHSGVAQRAQQGRIPLTTQPIAHYTHELCSASMRSMFAGVHVVCFCAIRALVAP